MKKTDLKSKLNKRGKEGYSTLIKEKKNLSTGFYSPKHIHIKHKGTHFIKERLLDLKSQRRSNEVRVGAFNTPFTPIVKYSGLYKKCSPSSPVFYVPIGGTIWGEI